MKQSQTRRLLEFMKANGGVTAMSAFSIGITSLHRRLFEIRQQGVDIADKWSNDKGTVKYKIYSIAKAKRK